MTKTQSTIPALPLRPTAPAAAGYACFVDVILWGLGATEEEARADAERHATDGFSERDRVTLLPVSAAVLDEGEGDGSIGGLVVTKNEERAYEAALDAWEEALEEWIEAMRPGWTLPGGSGEGDITEDEYRDLLEEMARALAAGNSAIRLASRTGTPVWATAGLDEPHLSLHADRAIKELSQALGRETAEYARRRLIEPRRDELMKIASVVWGGGWKDALAKELDIDTRRVQRWASGEVRIPASLLAEIKAGPIMSRARATAQAETARLRRMLAEAEMREGDLALLAAE